MRYKIIKSAAFAATVIAGCAIIGEVANHIMPGPEWESTRVPFLVLIGCFLSVPVMMALQSIWE